MDPKRERVVVAMSGGVDSSVAALLLTRQNYEVIGISMRLFSYEADATHGCCTPEDLYDARKVADQLGIPHYVSNFEVSFENKVIDSFVQSYRDGETPNPCTLCNQDVKFSALLKRARELGASYLATGHYARKETILDVHYLRRSKDRRRDQSYFLFGLSQQELAQILFPLGDLEKEEVRALAREAALLVADKPDSQEICFVSQDYSSFVEKRLSPEEIRPGKIVAENGNVLGEHSGIHNFTVGQRKGLGFQKSLPQYVLSISKEGTVVVGDQASLFKTTFEVRNVTCVDEMASGEELQAQIRSRFSACPASVEWIAPNRVRASFLTPQRAITPGQAAVFYKGDRLVAGGWIDRVL